MRQKSWHEFGALAKPFAVSFVPSPTGEPPDAMDSTAPVTCIIEGGKFTRAVPQTRKLACSARFL